MVAGARFERTPDVVLATAIKTSAKFCTNQ